MESSSPPSAATGITPGAAATSSGAGKDFSASLTALAQSSWPTIPLGDFSNVMKLVDVIKRMTSCSICLEGFCREALESQIPSFSQLRCLPLTLSLFIPSGFVIPGAASHPRSLEGLEFFTNPKINLPIRKTACLWEKSQISVFIPWSCWPVNG